MACLAGTLATSFARANELLLGLAGWAVSDETLRLVCYREGRRMRRWRQPAEGQAQAEPAAAAAPLGLPLHCDVDMSISTPAAPPVAGVAAPAPEGVPAPAPEGAPAQGAGAPTPPEAPEAKAFRNAKGCIELEIDAGKVNTTEGWRDVKLGVFAKREPGRPAEAEDWAGRRLPRPTVRVAFAAIEHCDDFGAQSRAWAARLGVTETSAVSVIADGADWIWGLVDSQFPNARRLLDIYHALEHVGAASRAMFGQGTEEGDAWQGRVRQALLSQGWKGVCDESGRTFEERPGEVTQAAMDELLKYFAPRRHLLGYAGRLQAGEPIGSGMVEGAVKTMVNKRLKANGARWRPENVTRMAELCSAHYSDCWAEYWQAI